MVKGKLIAHYGYYRFYELDCARKEDYWLAEKIEPGRFYWAGVRATLFEFLNSIGLPTAFVEYDPSMNSGLIEKKCRIVPLVWVLTRLATSDFVKRHPNVKVGSRLAALQVEAFHLDASFNRTFWSMESIKQAEFPNLNLEDGDIERMYTLARLVFEVMERVWQGLNRPLKELEMQFGVKQEGGIIVKGIFGYSCSATEMVKLLKSLISENKPPQSISSPSVAILMDSYANIEYGSLAKGITESLENNWRIFKTAKIICSVSESTQCSLDVIARLNEWPTCKCIIAIFYKNNLLSNVLGANSEIPVINCFPYATTSEQVWSSMSTPSVLGCTTILGADNCAKAAAQIVANDNIYVWCKMRCQRTLAALDRLSTERIGSKAVNKLIHY